MSTKIPFMILKASKLMDILFNLSQYYPSIKYLFHNVNNNNHKIPRKYSNSPK